MRLSERADYQAPLTYQCIPMDSACERLHCYTFLFRLALCQVFSSGHISVNAPEKKVALSVFENTAKQIIRVKKCTKCGVCLKVCTANAIVLVPHLKISKVCTRCGKCTQVCVVIKYFDRILPDFRYETAKQ